MNNLSTGGGEKQMKKGMGLLTAVFSLVAFSVPMVASAGLPAGAPKIFKKCMACHSTKYTNAKWKVGPGMKGIGKRLSRAYLEKWLADPQATFNAGGPEIDALKKGQKFKKKLKMPKQAKKLSAAQKKDLINFLLTL